MLHPSDYDYVQRLATAKTASERMADESQSKLLSKTIGPFRIIDTTSYRITIDGDGIPNLISMDQAKPAGPTTDKRTSSQTVDA